MTERARQRLLDALDACETIVSFVQGKTLDDYEDDVQLQLPTERLLTIIGEACSQAVRAQPDLGSRIPDLQKVIGMRNRIIHGYHLVDDEIVWEAVTDRIPELLVTLKHLTMSLE